MKKAVIYARFSSSKQREESIEGQVRECREYARREGYSVLKVYADRAISGRTDRRPEFQRMVADAAASTFAAVLIYKYDRFARNRYAFAVYEAKLKKLGVEVVSVRENVAEGAAGILLKSVLQGMAEWYSADLSEKVLRGMTDNALKGKWTSGSVPFGYTRDSQKHLVADPERAPYVQKIFEKVLAGEKIADIARWLNFIGMRTSSGCAFNKSSFARMLRNEAYIGVFRWRDIRKENAVPPLISKALFYAVQEKMAASERRGVNVLKSEKYLLTPNIICAECGGPMHGMSGKSRSGELYYYYACANKRAKKSHCHVSPLPKEELEGLVFDAAKKILSEDENIKLIAAQAAKVAEAQQDGELAELKAERIRNAKSINNYANAIANGATSGTIIELINAAEAKAAELDKAIAERELLGEAPQIDYDSIVFFLRHLAKLKGEKAMEEIIRAMVATVVVERDMEAEKEKDSQEVYSLTVKFNFTSEPQLSALHSIKMVREKSNLVNHSRIIANMQVFIYATHFEVVLRYKKRKFTKTS